MSLLQEQSRTTTVTATMERNGSTYDVNYTLENNVLRRLHCDVRASVKTPIETPEGIQHAEQPVHLGYMLNESGNKQISLREDAEIAPHLAVFEEILEEVKGTLTTKAK